MFLSILSNFPPRWLEDQATWPWAGLWCQSQLLTSWSRSRARGGAWWPLGILKLPDQLLPRPSYETMLRNSETMSRLQPDLRAKLMKLFSPVDAILEDESQILCFKFMANRISIGNKSNESAVFEVISMINHSCKPNVAWFTKEEDKMQKEVRVCRKIKEGEEIVASYVNLGQLPLRQQRQELLRPWAFECRYDH